MGFVTRSLAIVGEINRHQPYIAYSRYLVSDPRLYLDPAEAELLGCPMLKGEYDYRDEGIQGATPNNTWSVANNQAVVDFTTWDIDILGGVRIGDYLVGDYSKIGSGYIHTITKLNGHLILRFKTDAGTGSGTNIDFASLFPVGRGNFGPIVITCRDGGGLFEEVVTYQPPTTFGGNLKNQFVFDASEVMKVITAKLQNNRPDGPYLDQFKIRIQFDVYLDGAVVYTNTYNHGTCGIDMPINLTYAPLDNIYNNQIFQSEGNPYILEWSLGGTNTVRNNTYRQDADGPNGSILYIGFGGIVNCDTYPFLSIPNDYIGLYWLNDFGGFDLWFFGYSEGDMINGFSPRHQFNTGKSTLSRIDYAITQVNRGIATQSWDFNSGQVDTKFIPMLYGLLRSSVVWAITPGTEVSAPYGIFSVETQTGMIRVNIEDADWQDTLIGGSTTVFTGTVTACNILKGRQL